MVQLNGNFFVLHVYIDTTSCIQGGQKQLNLQYHFFNMLFVHFYYVFLSTMCIWSSLMVFFCLKCVYWYYIMYTGWSETALFTISFLKHAISSLLLCFSVYNVHMVQFYLQFYFFNMLFVHFYYVFLSTMCIWSN